MVRSEWLLGTAGAVAREVDAPALTTEHLLVAVAEADDDPGARALARVGVTPAALRDALDGAPQRDAQGADSHDGDARSGHLPVSPAATALLAAAWGHALGRGTEVPDGDDVLVAALWGRADSSEVGLLRRCGAEPAAVGAALEHEGIAVPAAPLPEPVEVVWGPDVHGPEAALADVVERLGAEVGMRWSWGWNLTGDARFVVSGEADADLPARIAAVVDPALLTLTDPGVPVGTVDVRDRGRVLAPTVDLVADLTADLAASRPDVRGAALIGSWARGTARPGSDVDLILLVDDVAAWFADGDWLDAYARLGLPRNISDENWGDVRSRRVDLGGGLEIEFGFASPAWATLPVDPGTAEVLRGGVRVLHDPDGALAAVVAHVHPARPEGPQ